MAIGERLREERKRLRMTQAKFAEVGCIGVSTLKLYENGDRDPGATLLYKLSENGVDAQYVITGIRSNTAMAADEQVLLDGYRSLDPATRKRLLAFVLTESGPVSIQKKIKEKTAETQITVTATGRGAQAAGKKIINKAKNSDQGNG